MASILPYDSYFRKYINRLDNSLVNPRVYPAQDFTIPKYSVIHYIPSSFDDTGPTISDPIFKDVKKQIGVTFVDSLLALENARITTTVITSDIRKYLSQNKRMRRVFDIESTLNDPESPLLVNYSFAARKYRMINSPKRDWYLNNAWIYTIASKMNDIYMKNEKSNQFILLPLPERVPNYQTFDKLNKNENDSNVRLFPSYESVFIFHLYNLIMPDTKRNAFGEIRKEVLSSINVVFVESGYFSILNLGKLYSWIKTLDNTSGKNPLIIRTYFIRFLLTLLKLRSDDPDEIISAGIAADNNDISAQELILKEETTETLEITDDDSDDDSEPSTPQIKDDSNISTQKDIPVEKKEDKSIKYNKDTDSLVYDPKIMTEEEKAELALIQNQLDEQIKIEEEIKTKKKIKEVEEKEALIFKEEPQSVEDVLLDQIDDLMDSGALSPADYKKFQNLSEKYKTIEIDNTTLDKFIKVDPKTLQVKPKEIKDNPIVKDKRMLKSTLIDFDSHYLDDVLEKDMASMVVNLQKGGIFVTDYKVETTSDSSGVFNNYTLKVTPIKGKPSTVKFRLPKVNSEGVYTSNGVEYRLRRQKTDMPIRKIKDTRVALTSSYGKLFIDRSERRAFNYQKWICNHIRAASLDKDNSRIYESRTGNVFDHTTTVPFLYSTLAKEFRTFIANDIYFYLDYHKREKRLGANVEKAEGSDYVACGMFKDKSLLVMDFNNKLYKYKDNQYTPQDDILTILGLNQSKEPIPMADIVLMGKSIPLGIVLGYKLGFRKLLKTLGVAYTEEEDFRGSKVPSDEFAITFKDRRFRFKKDNLFNCLILNGFNNFSNEIKVFNAHFFDDRDVYFNILDGKRVANRYLKEIDLLWNLFVDPITLKILKSMDEPTTFSGLLFRSVELLTNDSHPDEVSAFDQRIRSYERMPSLVYGEIVRALRVHNNKANSHLSSIDINPQDILLKFLNDPANVANKGLNPFQDMRQIEAATYVGIGGRSKETMVKRTRKFTPGDIGVISEASVDSGDVGVNMYTTANPQFINVYGVTDPATQKTREGDINPTEIMSSVFQTMPCIEKDDPKRINFASIQSDSNVFCSGYETMPLRTGYDSVIPYRVGSNFANMAKEDGKVASVTDFDITVIYKSGATKTYPIGRSYGSDGGVTVPHLLITPLKVGQSFKEGDTITYNSGYFTPDPANPKSITMKMGVLTRTAVLENPQTLEDGSAITQRLASKLGMFQTKIRNIRVDFNQELHNVVNPGQEVESDDILCIIEDEVTSKGSLFDKNSISLLKQLGAKAPKTKFKGIVEKVEVYYQGNKSDMTESLRTLANKSDRVLSEVSRSRNGKAINGSVGSNYLIDGERIQLNQMVIRFYISGETTAAVGDKGVFANQMKTTFGAVLPEPPKAENGWEIDAIFGARSINARMVNSPYLIGTTNTLLVEIGKMAAKMLKE